MKGMYRMSVVLMDSVTVSGTKIYISKNRSVTTKYSEAEKFSNMKKAMNFLGGSLPKPLRKYKFFAIPTENLDLATLADKDIELADDGALCNVAPTALELMGIEQPACMTGSPLV